MLRTLNTQTDTHTHAHLKVHFSARESQETVFPCHFKFPGMSITVRKPNYNVRERSQRDIRRISIRTQRKPLISRRVDLKALQEGIVTDYHIFFKAT